jgi:hypothetical protein
MKTKYSRVVASWIESGQVGPNWVKTDILFIFRRWSRINENVFPMYPKRLLTPALSSTSQRRGRKAVAQFAIRGFNAQIVRRILTPALLTRSLPLARPHSFRRFPSGSSPPLRAGEGKGIKRFALILLPAATGFIELLQNAT